MSLPPDTPASSTQYGDIHAGFFAGRDLHVRNDVPIAELQELLTELLALLRDRRAEVGDGLFAAGERRLDLSAEQTEALDRYLAVTPTSGPAEWEAHYLTRVCLAPEYQRWQRHYVTLSGSYRPPPKLTPTFTRIEVRGEGPQRQIERVALPDVMQAVNEHPAFILLAQPGAGKTTVMQRLALDLAMRRLQLSEAGGKPPLLPLFVSLAWQQPQETPEAFLERAWLAALPGATAAEFHEELQRGHLCLLCDALNEALRERYRERMWAWRDFAKRLPPGNRLLFSCRLQDYEGELAVPQVEIDPLRPEQIEAFCRRYLGDERGEALWLALQEEHKELLELAEVPYYLMMLAESCDDQGRPSPDRASLFDSFVQRLLTRERDEKRHPDWLAAEAQVLALSELAYTMQTEGTGTVLKRGDAVAAVPLRVTMAASGRVVETPGETVVHLAVAASLVTAGGNGAVKFMHHLLQEYFASLSLLRRWIEGQDLTALWVVPWREGEMPAAPRGEWDPLPPPPTTHWEETTLLAASLAPDLAATVGKVNPALAARCLLGQRQQDPAQVEASRFKLLSRLRDASVHLRSRIEAGLLLGRLGDPRFREETIGGVRVILPPLVEAPGGKATIGSSGGDNQAFADENPRHSVVLAPYAFGRYPVTNAEYGCFMKAGGYDEEGYWRGGGSYWRRGEPAPGEADPAQWWIDTWRRRKANPGEIEDLLSKGILTAHAARIWRNNISVTEEVWLRAVEEWYPKGVRYREPRYWTDDAFNNPAQPVVGVCWYEATAYAAWLAEVTGMSFRLPTEAEWEWAAGRGGRTYPWGQHWEPHRANSLEGRVMRTTPVGVYPGGDTPDGIADLVGNVWEWTATLYADYPYDPGAGLEASERTGLRIARGGGWAAGGRMLRCAFRDWGYPWDRYNDLGFRLARTSPSVP